jgi:hypothetical protein
MLAFDSVIKFRVFAIFLATISIRAREKCIKEMGGSGIVRLYLPPVLGGRVLGR